MAKSPSFQAEFDALPSANPHEDALNGLANALPTPTGLPNINEPTSAQGAPSRLLDATISATPGLGQINEAAKIMNNHPTGRRILNEGAGMTAGTAIAAPALSAVIAGSAAAAPEAVLPTIGAAVVGAGAGNVIGGLVSDIEDDPQKAKVAFDLIANPLKPGLGTQLLQAYQKDPDGTIQIAKAELLKAGQRFTNGAVGQLLSFGLQSLVPSMGGLDIAAKEIPGAKQLLEDNGLQSDPSMYTTSKISKVMKGMASRSVLSADKINKINANNELILTKNIGDLTSEMAGNLIDEVPPSELAKMISAPKQVLGEPLQKQIQNTLYARVKDIMSGAGTPKVNDPMIMMVDGVPNRVNSVRGTAANPYGLAPVQSAIPVPVSMIGLKNVAEDIAVPMEKINNLPAAVSENINTAVKAIRGMPNTVDFEAAHMARSALLDAIRESNNSTLVRLAKMGSSAVDFAMETAAKSAGDDAYNAWRDANAFYKAGKETFSNELVAKMFISDDTLPEKVGKNLFNNGTATQVRQLKKVAQRVQDLVDNPKNVDELAKVISANPEAAKLIASGGYTYDATMGKVKAGMLQNIFSNNIRVNPESMTGNQINYGGVLEELNPKSNPEGYATLKEVFPENQISKLRDTMKAGYLAIQNAPKDYDRAMAWGLRILAGAMGTSVGQIVGVPAKGFLLGEGAFLLSEGKLAAYLLTDEKAAPIFMKGMSMMAQKGPAAIRAGTDLIVKSVVAFADKRNKDQGE